MARIYKSNVFEGMGGENNDVPQRKQIVVIAPVVSEELVWTAVEGVGLVLPQHLGRIQLHSVSAKVDPEIKGGSTFVLTDRRQESTEDDPTGYGQPPRLETAVANVAVLASMGLEGGAVQIQGRSSLDRGMAVLFPGAVKVGPDTPPEAGALVPAPVS